MLRVPDPDGLAKPLPRLLFQRLSDVVEVAHVLSQALLELRLDEERDLGPDDRQPEGRVQPESGQRAADRGLLAEAPLVAVALFQEDVEVERIGNFPPGE